MFIFSCIVAAVCVVAAVYTAVKHRDSRGVSAIGVAAVVAATKTR